MKQTTVFAIVSRIAGIALALLAFPGSGLSQNSETVPVLFYSELQPLPLTLQVVLPPDLSVDALHKQVLPTWHSMFTDIPTDFAKFGSLTISSKSIPTIASLGLLTVSLMETDHQSYRSTRRLYRESNAFRGFSNYSVALGDGRLHAGIIAMFAGYGWIADDSRALTTASETAEAFLATGITVQLLKRISGRESPISATRNNGRWKFLPKVSTYQKHQTSYYAYPSGHISTAMATLTVIAENYPDQSWLRPVGYSMMGALGAGLVAKGMHWYSDLPLGIALGYIFGKTASHPDISEIPEASQSSGVNVSLTPSFDAQGGSGVRFAVNF